MRKNTLFIIALFFSFHVNSFSQDYLKIKNVISDVSTDSLIENLNLLTGVKDVNLNGQSIKITSRYRGTVGNANAALFLKNKLSNYKNLTVNFQPLPDSGKNVIAVQTGKTNPKRQIIVCGHFDSMPLGPISTGADDDGTGTVAVLEAARIFSKYESSNTIVFALFDQEEDNLNGSEYYAAEASKTGDTIVAVINLDMMGWDKNNQFDIEIDTKPIGNSLQLAKEIKDVNDNCAIGLYVTVVNPGADNADQFSFWKRNYSAVLLTETYGNQNPYYHKTSDNIQIINKPYFERCTKLGIASVARYTNLIALVSTNNAPTAKLVNVIPSTAFVGQAIKMQFKVADPENDSVRIKVDWGDEVKTDYSKLIPTNAEEEFTHVFTQPGIYILKEEAEDEHGEEGNWVAVDTIQIKPATSITELGKLPAEFRLLNNYPNPFNPSTIINYHIASVSNVSLKIFDMLGREIITLVNETQLPGSYNALFNCGNLNISSGIYFYTLKAGNLAETKKMLLIK